MNSIIIGLLCLALLSALSGWFFSRSKKVEKPVKAMLFVLYFWVSFFIQLAIFAVLHYFDLLDKYL
ncbi:MAG: hypothetical protein QM500_10945 [Methylococcales bacterium]